MTIALNAEVRAKLDAHLDAVEQALIAGGSSRERRRGVVDDLEAQIMDMLAARSETPTVADLDAVLATLDPPAAYGQAASGEPMHAAMPVVTPAPGPMARPRYSRAAIAGLICILVSVVPLGLMAVVGFFWVHAAVPEPVRASNQGAVILTDVFERDPATGDWRQTVVRLAPETSGVGRQSPSVSSVNEPMATTAPSTAVPSETRRGRATGPVITSEYEPVAELERRAGDSQGARKVAEQSARAGGYELNQSAPAPYDWQKVICVLVPILPLALAGTILGWIAFFQIRASKGMLRGTGLALFDALLYPALVFLALGLAVVA